RTDERGLRQVRGAPREVQTAARRGRRLARGRRSGAAVPRMDQRADAGDRPASAMTRDSADGPGTDTASAVEALVTAFHASCRPWVLAATLASHLGHLVREEQ